MEMAGEIWGDARAALGIIHRNGLGKTRHIDTGLLWIQQTAAQQRLKFDKVLGKENPADMYTKYLDWASLERHTQRFHCEFASGRAAEAPQLHRISQSLDEYWMMGESRQWLILDQILGALTDKHEKRQRRIERGNLNTLTRTTGTFHYNQTTRWTCRRVDWRAESAGHWERHNRTITIGFPLRDVSQRSSTARSGMEPGELSRAAEPKATVLSGLRER